MPQSNQIERGGIAGCFCTTEDWLTPTRFALLLGGLVVISFPQILLGFETFVFRDYGLFAYPNAHYQRDCFWHGELPFWNPYNNCGVPFLAQWNTMALYPPTLIYLLLPLSWSLGFFCLLHLWFGGLGMFFLTHHWTGNRLAAAIAGVSFAFNGFSLNFLIWPSHEATWSWMPWVVYAVERAWREGRGRVVVASVAGALQMLAGGPETILFTWVIALALWAVECSRNRDWMRSALRFGLVVLLVAALAAPQLLSFLELATHSQRGVGFGNTRWSMPSRGWTNFLVPMAFGSTWKEGVFFQHGQEWTSSYYFGIGGLLLALLSVWTVRERRTWCLTGLAVVALIFAQGDQTALGGWLRSQVPQLTVTTYPVKFVMVIIFAASLLAGLAAARWFTVPLGRKPRTENVLLAMGGGLLLLIGIIVLYARRSPLPYDDFPATLHNAVGRAGFLAVVIALLCLLRRNHPEGRQRMFSLTLLAVLWLDLWTHEPAQNPTAPPAVYTPGLVRTELALDPSPALGKSRVMISPGAEERFGSAHMADVGTGYLAARMGYFCNCNLLDDTPKVNGFFSLSPRESNGLIGLFYVFTNIDLSRLLDFLSVSHITAPGEYVRWQPRTSFLPEVTAGQKAIFLDDTNAVHRLMRRDFDGTKVVCLPLEAASLVSATNQTEVRVTRQTFKRHRVDLELEAAQPSLVVIAQTYYPCWRAYVNGRRVPLLRANYAFQALEVPAGSQRVRLEYEDRAFQFGSVLAGLASLGCAAGWMRRHRLRCRTAKAV